MNGPAPKPFPAFVANERERTHPFDLIALNRHALAREAQSKAEKASDRSGERKPFCDHQAGFGSFGGGSA